MRDLRLRNLSAALSCTLWAITAVGCSPRVEVTAPSEPITVNLNVKIDHEVRVRVEKDLEEVISPKSDLF